VLVSGYSHKTGLFAEMVLEKLRTCTFAEDVFERIRKVAKRSYLNFKMEQPYQHALYQNNMCLEQTRHHLREKLACIDALTVADVSAHRDNIVRSHFITSFIHGNISAAGALALVDKVVDILGSAESPLADTTPQVAIPHSVTCRAFASPDWWSFLCRTYLTAAGPPLCSRAARSSSPPSAST
jgi:insulysin